MTASCYYNEFDPQVAAEFVTTYRVVGLELIGASHILKAHGLQR